MTARILATAEAKKLIDHLREDHGPLMFHQSGGCCDGSAPMCFPKGELMLDDNDVWLGKLHGCYFYMSRDQFEYWQHTQLTIDVVVGRGASFSLEIPLGLRFLIKSRLYSEAEAQALSPVHFGLHTD
jgi:uncharacterized protein (DUF779 family)